MLFRSNKIDSDTLSKSDFKHNNYVYVKYSYDECFEKNIKITNYELNGNDLKVKIKYTEDCVGYCITLKESAYLFKVNKNVDNMNVTFDYDIVENPKCRLHFNQTEKKPVIYLYPKETTKVTVKLLNKKLITTSYPKYSNSWVVTAKSDGTLIDENNKEYYGLYWEGKNHYSEIKEDGFVVKGVDTIKFLEDKLSYLGLNDKERNEFIIYWLKHLENNKYNYIRFETEEEINSYMPIEVTPKPDTIIRVWMTYKPLKERISVKEQKLKKGTRNGFVLVEWGGSEI